MLIERFTVKAQGVIEKACRLAVKKTHQFVTPIHLALALFEQQDSLGRRYLTPAGVDIETLVIQLDSLVDKILKAAPDSQDTPINRELEKLFIKAEELATQMGDKDVDISHLLLAMLENADILEILTASGTSKRELENFLQDVKNGKIKGVEDPLDEYEYLSKYTIDITGMAKDGKLDPVIGRDAEIRQVIQILSRRIKNNPLIIGEPGVGKTAIVEGLAQRIVHDEVPENLQSNTILSLDLGQLIAGAKYRGEFEERFKRVLRETSTAENIILFIDEMHMLIGAGGSEGSVDASNLLKPALSRGQIRCIGASTIQEYRKRIEKDSALTRRFQTVKVEEPTTEETISIIRGLKEKYELHHGIRIADNAISAAARLSDRYITERFLPDKAIDLIDETAAALRMDVSSKPKEIEAIDRDIIQMEIEIKAIENEESSEFGERLLSLHEKLKIAKEKSEKLTNIWQKEIKGLYGIRQAKKDLEAAKQEMEQKVREENFARVAELQYKVIPNCEKILTEFGDIDLSEVRFLREVVGEEDIAASVSRWTGIPVNSMLQSERDKLINMEDRLRERVVGQEEALVAVSKAIRRSRAGLQDPSRPIACFLMLGPTGVGKTELAKTLAEFIFDDERAMMRTDMSEYMEKHAVARLIGAPPGYVGYDEGGQLTDYIRNKPYSVVLLDEVEKAHHDVFNILLQVMDDGRLTDGQGQTVNFSNTIVIMTSNLGSQVIEDFDSDEQYHEMKVAVMEQVRAHFRPEFINRLDDILIFHRLGLENMKPIVKIQLKHLEKLLANSKIKLKVTDEALEFLAQEGYNPAYGARPLKRVILKCLQDPLSEAILEQKIKKQQTAEISLADGEIIIKSTK